VPTLEAANKHNPDKVQPSSCWQHSQDHFWTLSSLANTLLYCQVRELFRLTFQRPLWWHHVWKSCSSQCRSKTPPWALRWWWPQSWSGASCFFARCWDWNHGGKV